MHGHRSKLWQHLWVVSNFQRYTRNVSRNIMFTMLCIYTHAVTYYTCKNSPVFEFGEVS